jgi:hypothetical protein
MPFFCGPRKVGNPVPDSHVLDLPVSGSDPLIKVRNRIFPFPHKGVERTEQNKILTQNFSKKLKYL